MSSQNDYQSNGRYDNIYSQIDSEAKMSFSVDVLANIAIELQRGIGHQDRFQRLITTLRQVLECDASALLRYDSRQFIPLAIDGLAKDVLGRHFALEGHPRLEAIARAACHAAVKANDPLNEITAKALLKSLQKCQRPDVCPHGRPTVLKMSKNELARRFGRI